MVKNPKRGDIWLVTVDPQVGAEIKKTRPAIVININEMGHLPTRLVIPIRERKNHHRSNLFYLPIEPTPQNGLNKPSTLDCSQLKSLSLQRFVKKLGVTSGELLKELTKLIALEVGYF